MFTLIILGLVCYLLASLSLLLFFLGKKDIFMKSAKYLALAGVLVLTVFVKIHIVSQPINIFSSGEASLSKETYFAFFAWFCSISLAFVSYFLKNPLLFLLPSPIIFLLLHTAMLAHGSGEQMPFAGVFFTLYIVTFFITLTCLIVGACAALLFLIQEKAMKRKKNMKTLFKHYPSLDVLDKINNRVILFAFPFYTLSVISALLWASDSTGTYLNYSIKELMNFIVWILFAFMFYMRIGLGYKGKKPALLLLLVCGLALFSLFGINTLFENPA